MRNDFKAQAKRPLAAEVQTKLLDPLTEVRNRVAEELAKRESGDSMVAIDRDPVPARYSELVRKYYERIGGDTQPQQTPVVR